MRNLRGILGAGMMAWSVQGGLVAQDDMADVEITVQHVRGHIFVLMGRGGNIGLSAGDDGALLVDDQYAPLTERIRTAVAGITPHEVRFVANTHWHFDHTGGNENFGDAGALIVAHDNVRRRMSIDGFIGFLDIEVPASPPGALPVITFTEDVTLHWNGEAVRVTHVPNAHTDGDAIVWFTGVDVVHMGDTFFNGRFPFVDVSSGGSLAGVVRAADHVLAHATSRTRIIPGHGPVASVEDLRAYRDALDTIHQRLVTMRNDGWSDDEIVAARPTREFDDWGAGSFEPDDWVRLILSGMDPGH